MAKGENIFKRKDGRWEARYVKGHDEAGRVRYGYCYGKTYREAKEKAFQKRSEWHSGRVTECPAKKPCFGDCCDEWLSACKSSLKESTYVKYTSILERRIKPRLGDCMLQNVTTARITKFRDELLEEEHLAPKTVKDILVVLRSILKYVEKTHPGCLSAIEMIYPKERKKEMRILTHEEQTILTKHLLMDMDACKFGILLALSTGMRIGELCALQWENICLREQTIKICKTMQRLHDIDNAESRKTKIVIDSPKSDTSSRTIPIPEFLMAFCRDMRAVSGKAYVLTGTEVYMEPRALQYRLQKYVQECGLKAVNFHALRHTFATRCVEVGFEIKTLSEILGHSTTTITLDRYVHSSLEMKRINMNKLPAVAL